LHRPAQVFCCRKRVRSPAIEQRNLFEGTVRRLRQGRLPRYPQAIERQELWSAAISQAAVHRWREERPQSGFRVSEGNSRKTTKASGLLLPYASHGDAIKGLPLWPEGEFYERPDTDGNFSWYYMSRNRKAKWADPAFTVVANWRHITLHPASPVMTLTWSNLADGWKQRWDFSDQYEHLEADPKRKKLEKPRRLSWRECALIQTFDTKFTPVGETESKFTQIGNAVPPKLAQAIFTHLFSGAGLVALDAPFVRKAI